MLGYCLHYDPSIHIIHEKVRMFVYLLLNQAATNERISIKLGIVIEYDLNLHIYPDSEL